MNVKIINHSVSLQGKRPTNEDSHFIIKNKIWSIHDGHGGSYISTYLKKILPKVLMKCNNSNFTSSCIKSGFNNIHKNLKNKHSKYSYTQGSTVLTTILYNNNKLKIINLGDCRAVLCRENLAIPLTKDHKPYWDDEKKRISDLGGIIKKDRGDDWRIGNLSVSRSIGDLELEKYISHVPDIFNHVITMKDQFLIMACDGLWDVIDNQEAVQFVNMYSKNKNISKLLAEHAIKKGSTDNITIIILFFKK